MSYYKFTIISISLLFGLLMSIAIAVFQTQNNIEKKDKTCYFLSNINGNYILSSRRPERSGRSDIYVIYSLDGKEYFSTIKPTPICDEKIRKVK